MKRTFRFLWMFSWPNLVTLAGFAVVIVLGSSLTGVPQGADNIFATAGYVQGFEFQPDNSPDLSVITFNK